MIYLWFLFFIKYWLIFSDPLSFDYNLQNKPLSNLAYKRNTLKFMDLWEATSSIVGCVGHGYKQIIQILGKVLL